MTVQAFADAVGVTRGAVQQWEKEGGTAPKRNNQKAVADLLEISVAELMHPGEDFIEMEQAQPKLLAPPAQSPPAPDPVAAEIVGLLAQMSVAGRAEALEYVKYLAKKHSAFFSAGGSGRQKSSPSPSIESRLSRGNHQGVDRLPRMWEQSQQ